MDDMRLSWLTQDVSTLLADVNRIPEPPPPVPVTMQAMRELIERVRAEEEDNKLGVAYMCHPDSYDEVDALLRRATELVVREHGAGSTRRWTLTASSHVPRGQVISWRTGPLGKPLDALPPIGIVR